MPGKQMRSITTQFAAVQTSQETLGLKKRVQELEAEISKLRESREDSADEQSFLGKEELEEKIRELTEQLAQEGGIHKIPLSKIHPDPNQPRTIFPEAVINARAESLKREGQLTPIIVIPLENGDYRLFEGQLRWTAAPRAGMTYLHAVVRHEEDELSTFDRQLTTSIQSEKLHDLDLARGLMKLIQFQRPDLTEQGIVSSLNKALHWLNSRGRVDELAKVRTATQEEQQTWLKSTDLNEDQQFVLQIILGKALNPSSIYANCFPLLKLPQDLQEAMGQGMEPSKARELGKLTAEKLKKTETAALLLRKKLTEQAIKEQWSLSVLRKKIKESTQVQEAAKPRPTKRLLEKVQEIEFKEEDIDPEKDREDLEELEKRLQKQLEQVRKLLQV